MKTINIVPLKLIEVIVDKFPNEIHKDLSLFLSYDKESKKYIALDNRHNWWFVEEYYSLTLAILYLLEENYRNISLLSLVDYKAKVFRSRIKSIANEDNITSLLYMTF